jgi:hypothetical protein
VELTKRQTRWRGPLEPERARATRRNQQIGPPGRAYQPERGKSFVGHAVNRQDHHPLVGRYHHDRPAGVKFRKTTLYGNLLWPAEQARRATPSHITHASLNRTKHKSCRPNKNSP